MDFLKAFLTYKKEFFSIRDDKSAKMEFLHLNGKRRKTIGKETYRNFFNKKNKNERYYGDN